MNNPEQKKVQKSIITYIATFFVTALILFGLMFLVTMIPRSAIKENMLKSAKYLCDKDLMNEYVIKGVDGSIQDHYADSILLGIIWQLDPEHPLSSMMETGYYSDEKGFENIALYSAVTKSLASNKEYIRYWHGSSIVVKPLLMICGIKGIYVINAFILAALLAASIVLLIRRKAVVPAVGLGISLILVSVWFVPMTLEFTWCFLVMSAFLLLLLLVQDKWTEERITLLFMICGMVTSYFDFLTTELITLFVPLLILIWFEKKRAGQVNYWLVVRRTVLWGLGYSLMWMLKWALAALILHRDVITGITSQIGTRVGGEYAPDIKLSLLEYIKMSLWTNLKCLFPVEYGPAGMIIAFLILAAAGYILFVFSRKGFDKGLVAVYIIICIIPFIRLMVLHNHSYLHHFFTYRAQIISVLALILCMDEVALPEMYKSFISKFKDGVQDGKK